MEHECETFMLGIYIKFLQDTANNTRVVGISNSPSPVGERPNGGEDKGVGARYTLQEDMSELSTDVG